MSIKRAFGRVRTATTAAIKQAGYRLTQSADDPRFASPWAYVQAARAAENWRDHRSLIAAALELLDGEDLPVRSTFMLSVNSPLHPVALKAVERVIELRQLALSIPLLRAAADSWLADVYDATQKPDIRAPDIRARIASILPDIETRLSDDRKEGRYRRSLIEVREHFGVVWGACFENISLLDIARPAVIAYRQRHLAGTENAATNG